MPQSETITPSSAVVYPFGPLPATVRHPQLPDVLVSINKAGTAAFIVACPPDVTNWGGINSPIDVASLTGGEKFTGTILITVS